MAEEMIKACVVKLIVLVEDSLRKQISDVKCVPSGSFGDMLTAPARAYILFGLSCCRRLHAHRSASRKGASQLRWIGACTPALSPPS